ncbi:MAG: ATP synthase F1 subunit epsilon [Alphaproteobacteria bacterium]|jgi:F-type H+-transporting ATPase subunit epsilon|nr:ATP synthase F1 subunit epsilon [Alphaproteobacteria bacterium]
MKELALHIQTPKETFIHNSVSKIQLPGSIGPVGVLPNHAPMILELISGVIHISKTDSSSQRYFINPGIAYVKKDLCLILTEQSKHLSDLDALVLNAELENYHQTLAGLDVGYEYRLIERQIKIIRTMLKALKEETL